MCVCVCVCVCVVCVCVCVCVCVSVIFDATGIKEFFSSSPWIVSLALLGREGRWRIHRAAWSLAGNDSPSCISSPAYLELQKHGLDADDLQLTMEFNIGDEVTPVYVKFNAEAALVELFGEL